MSNKVDWTSVDAGTLILAKLKDGSKAHAAMKESLVKYSMWA